MIPLGPLRGAFFPLIEDLFVGGWRMGGWRRGAGQDMGCFQHPISVASGAKSPLFSRRHTVHTAARGAEGAGAVCQGGVGLGGVWGTGGWAWPTGSVPRTVL